MSRHFAQRKQSLSYHFSVYVNSKHGKQFFFLNLPNNYPGLTILLRVICLKHGREFVEQRFETNPEITELRCVILPDFIPIEKSVRLVD